MTVKQFAKEVGLTHQRVYQLIRSGRVKSQLVNIQVNDITEVELKRFKSLKRPSGRPKKS